ncbi:MAG: DUF4831 family protein [Rikenellaceae bacterium]
MRKILLSFVCLLVSFIAASEQVTSFSDNPSSMMYTLPRTSLKARFVVERHSVRKGVYARYAQKYLGTIAPLSDKEVYSIKAASLSSTIESDPSEIYTANAQDEVLAALIKKYASLPMPLAEEIKSKDENFTLISEQSQPALSQDKINNEFKTQEQMAEGAANAIFFLRKRRLELITGDQGENVFGAGLKAALDEIKRQEDNLVALFLGEEFKSQEVKEFELVPQKDKFSYIVCRFSSDKGIVSAGDLSASPIVLELTQEKLDPKINLPRKEIVTNVKDKEVLVQDLFKYKVAAVATCRIVEGSNELVSERIPIYQYGVVVDIPYNIEIIKK